VLERIERNAAEHHSGRIPEPHRRPGVGAFMDAEGENQNNDLKEDDNNVQRHVVSSLLNFA
jgi:hypothetical protein